MKTVVVYKSKYGSTKKYAEWIAKEAGADLIENSKLKVDSLLSYGTIIYGGGIYAGGLNGFSVIKKNYDKLKDKNIIVFAVGTSFNGEKAAEDVKGRNFTEEMKNNIKLFFLRGGYNFHKLKILDRFAMSMFKKIIEKTPPEKRDGDLNQILDMYNKSVDFTDKESISPILELLK